VKAAGERETRTVELDDTQTIEPEILDIASYYHAHSQRTAGTKLQSVMERNPLERTAYEDDSEEGVVTGSAGIDSQRIQSLRSQSVSKMHKATLEKVLFVGLIFLAILGGIIGGYYLVQVFTVSDGSKNVLETELQQEPANLALEAETVVSEEEEVEGNEDSL